MIILPVSSNTKNARVAQKGDSSDINPTLLTTNYLPWIPLGEIGRQEDTNLLDGATLSLDLTATPGLNYLAVANINGPTSQVGHFEFGFRDEISGDWETLNFEISEKITNIIIGRSLSSDFIRLINQSESSVSAKIYAGVFDFNSSRNAKP